MFLTKKWLNLLSILTFCACNSAFAMILNPTKNIYDLPPRFQQQAQSFLNQGGEHQFLVIKEEGKIHFLCNLSYIQSFKYKQIGKVLKLKNKSKTTRGIEDRHKDVGYTVEVPMADIVHGQVYDVELNDDNQPINITVNLAATDETGISPHSYTEQKKDEGVMDEHEVADEYSYMSQIDEATDDFALPTFHNPPQTHPIQLQPHTPVTGEGISHMLQANIQAQLANINDEDEFIHPDDPDAADNKDRSATPTPEAEPETEQGNIAPAPPKTDDDGYGSDSDKTPPDSLRDQPEPEPVVEQPLAALLPIENAQELPLREDVIAAVSANNHFDLSENLPVIPLKQLSELPANQAQNVDDTGAGAGIGGFGGLGAVGMRDTNHMQQIKRQAGRAMRRIQTGSLLFIASVAVGYLIHRFFFSTDPFCDEIKGDNSSFWANICQQSVSLIPGSHRELFISVFRQLLAEPPVHFYTFSAQLQEKKPGTGEQDWLPATEKFNDAASFSSTTSAVLRLDTKRIIPFSSFTPEQLSQWLASFIQAFNVETPLASDWSLTRKAMIWHASLWQLYLQAQNREVFNPSYWSSLSLNGFADHMARDIFFNQSPVLTSLQEKATNIMNPPERKKKLKKSTRFEFFSSEGSSSAFDAYKVFFIDL